jgi:hypothetical protein
MAGFETAIGFLPKSPEFAGFVGARDPILQAKSADSWVSISKNSPMGHDSQVLTQAETSP